ncbi:MAG: acyl-CoA reductase [Cytophagales bacterium]|nr:acyl-CoA reductase [Cytophagales bacterium]
MNLEKRIRSFIHLGEKLSRLLGLKDNNFEEFCRDAIGKNSWFTSGNVKLALGGIIKYLNEDDLRKWLQNYKISKITKSSNHRITKSKRVGVVMAGNIPMVGFHDFLTVLLSGYHIYVKLSSQDPILLKKIAGILIEIEPEFEQLIHFVPLLDLSSGQKKLNAIIATGSDNSTRYFEYYFREVPHIVRKNRTSCAILDGTEGTDEFRSLGEDILFFFGLGCRNVSKLFVPDKWNEFDRFLKSIKNFEYVPEHSKYANNYHYNKAVLLVNEVQYSDNGFLLMTENDALVSPISVVYYEHYQSLSDLDDKIQRVADNIQCIVSKKAWYPGSIGFAETQKPHVWDYADGVDTMEFLLEL